jgi:hypothetical protein
MQLAGPNAAMSGTDPRELSGRAILAQQAGGSVQNEPLADSLRMWSRRVYETIWMAVREYWTAGKWVRVTDELQETRWVGINRPITLMDELANMPDQQRAQVMQQMQLVPDDPRLQQVIRIDNDITDLDVDITIQEGQDIPTLQAETFQTLVQLASMQPGLIPGDVLIAASSLRNKEQLLARMKDHMQQQQQAAQQQGQVAQQMTAAKIADMQSKANANNALAGERQHNVVHGAHDMLMDLNQPPDNPQGAGPQPPSPEQMTPNMALAHQMADLAQKHATIRNTQAKTAQALGSGNALGPEMMAAHASGGLVRRTMGSGDFTDRLPQANPTADPRMVARPYDNTAVYGMPNVDQGNLNQMPGQVVQGVMPGAYAHGGPITQMGGPNPPGPDTGFITAKPGEYVIQRSAVARYGPELLDAINAGVIDPKALQMSGAHAAADLAKKQADVVNALHQAANTAVTTNRLAQTPIPQPQPARPQ